MSSSAADVIQKTIVDEAKADAKRMIAEAEVSARQLTEEATENAKTNLVGWADRRRQMAQASGDRIIGKARNDAHMKILDAKARIINDAFEQARKRFEKERGTAQYKTFLKYLIISAGIQIGGGDIIVNVRKEDQVIISKITGLATAISKAAGESAKVSVGKKPMDMIGGVFIQNKAGNITVDYRVETLLAQVEQQQRSEIAKTLFPKEDKTQSDKE